MNKYIEKIAEKQDISVVFAKHKDGWAASTRPPEKARYPGQIGVPGGKADSGETPRETAMRESKEEGWKLHGLEEEPFHVQDDGSYRIHSFFAKGSTPLKKWKEEHRGIRPLKATLEELVEAHHTNVAPIEELRKRL